MPITLLVFGQLVEKPALPIPTPTAEALGCPSAARVSAALSAKIDARDHDFRGWLVLYEKDQSTTSPTLLVRLRQPTGQTPIERRIPADDCDLAADFIATVVARHFREIGWTRSVALRPVNHRGARAADAAGPRAGQLDGLMLTAGPAVATHPASALHLALDVRLRLAGQLHARLGGLLAPAESFEGVAAGRARLGSWGLRAATAFQHARGRMLLSFGPEILVRFETAHTTRIRQPSRAGRALLGLGAVAGVTLTLSPRWSLGLEIAGYRTALGPEFYVDTDRGRQYVLAPPPWQGMLTFSVGWTPWP